MLLALVVALAMLTAGWLWLRDSSLVAVERVSVSGVTGGQANAVRAALDAAGREMTTLSVDQEALRSAVARFPVVRDVRTAIDFPHGLKITVIERVPVGAIQADGSAVVVASDGTLLRDLPAGDLPVIRSAAPPAGGRVSDRRTQVKVDVLAAAPPRLRKRIVRVTLGPQGLVAVLTTGPKLRFGDGARLEAKWSAAVQVLRDPIAAAAGYMDLRVPERPAAGGLSVEQGGTQVAPPPAPQPAAAAPAVTTVAPAATTAASAAATPPSAAPTTP